MMDTEDTEELDPSLVGKRFHYFHSFGYYNIHFSYFLLIGLLGSVAIFINEGNIQYIDALFMSFSSCTQAGLETLDTSTLKFSTQIVFTILILLGGMVISTIPTIISRMYFLNRIFKEARRAGYIDALPMADVVIEYNATKWLLRIVICYHVLVHAALIMAL